MSVETEERKPDQSRRQIRVHRSIVKALKLRAVQEERTMTEVNEEILCGALGIDPASLSEQPATEIDADDEPEQRQVG